MIKVVIPYYSGSGHTTKIAEQIKIGAETCGVAVSLINIDPIGSVEWNELHSADAIIFGAPTYMGSLPWQFKLFMDQTSEFWLDQKWHNKVAAGFTVGASTSGDKLNSLIQLSVFSAQHGMIWVGQDHVGSKHTADKKRINDSGAWLGLSATSNPNKDEMIYEHDALTSRIFGERIVKVVQNFLIEK